MKILHIHTDDLGGGATNVAKAISDQASLYDSQSFWLVANKYSSEANIDSLPFSSWRKRWSQFKGSDINGFLSAQIFKHPSYQQADIVHLHNLHGYYFDLNILPQICKDKKVLWTFHDLWPLTASCSHTERWDSYRGLSLCHGPKLYPRFLLRRQKPIINQKLAIYSEANFTIAAPCQWMKDKIRQSALANKSCELIYNGINTELFKERDKNLLRKKFGLNQDKKIAIFLADGASKNRWKGWQYYSELRKRHSNDLFFVSIGHDLGDLVKGYNYWQLPRLNQLEVSEYLALADVFIFTSVFENFPLVVLEAMASGLPVISFDVGGVKEVLQHQHGGYLVAANNLNDFSEAITRFLGLNDSDIFDIKKFNKSLIIKNFTSEVMSSNYYQVYQDLLVGG